MDLLRLLAMLMVCTVHACFTSLGAPEPSEMSTAPGYAIGRYVVEALAIGGVDIFVLLSGWFGIHFSLKKLSSLAFQIFFFSAGLFIVFTLGRGGIPTVDDVKSIFLLNGSDYWFIKAYIILYLLSPFLNTFCQQANQRTFTIILGCYLIFHLIYGWLEGGSIAFTMNGTTGLSFIALYLIGRYLRLYPGKLTSGKAYHYFIAYLLCSLLIAATCTLLAFYGIRTGLDDRLLNYGNPLIWLASAALLLCFSKLHIKSKFISWAAASCLAVYLLHCNRFVFSTYYTQPIREWADDGSWLTIIGFVALVYMSAILIDKVRLWVWQRMPKPKFIEHEV